MRSWLKQDSPLDSLKGFIPLSNSLWVIKYCPVKTPGFTVHRYITLKAFIIHIKPSPSQKSSRLRAEGLNSERSLSPSQLLCVRHCPMVASDVASDGHQLICSATGPWPTLRLLLGCTLHGESGCLSPFLLRCPDAISPSSSSHHTVWGR